MCDRVGAVGLVRALVPVAGMVEVAVEGIIAGCCGAGGELLDCAIVGCEAIVALVAGASTESIIHRNLVFVQAGLSGFVVDDCPLSLSSC